MSNGTGAWSYAYSDSGTTRTTTVTDPLGHTRVMVINLTTALVSSDTDGAGETSRYTYDAYGRLLTSQTPGGLVTSYAYDARGNVVTKIVGVGNSSPSQYSFGFDATCTNAIKCNQANWTRDPLNNQTDYSYTSAGLLTQILKPAGANGYRRQINLSYAQNYAFYNQGSGIAQALAPIWLLSASYGGCALDQSCWSAGTNVQSALTYGTSGAANNLLQTSIYTDRSDGALGFTTSNTYDNVGNVVSTTDPLGYVTQYRYDAGRELVGVVGPAPNGGGATHNRAARASYDAAGRVILAESGWTASQSDADWANFTSMIQKGAAYDSAGRKAQDSLISGGVTQSIEQYAYDNANRLTCTAIRMNASVFGSLPLACQLGANGPYGQDRLTSLGYDNADRVTSKTVGYLTSVARTESTSYTADSQVQTQTDARNDRTTFVYDGFDRLVQVEFPTTSNNSATSSTTDYEQYSYDANFRVVSDRRRDGRILTYSYDGAGFLSSLGDSASTLGNSYTYDTYGRVLTASGQGVALTYTYDVLGRTLTESGPLGTITDQYDFNNQRTAITYPDGWVIHYTYDAYGLMIGISDSSQALQGFAYDDLGRRTLSGTQTQTTSYSYDGASNLSALHIDFADSTKDQNFVFAYNPAGQLRASTASNSLYDYAPSAGVNRAYGADGQNRYTTSGGVALGYDARGNVNNDTQMTYTYDSQNNLTSLGNGATLTYDPNGRLFQTTGATTTRFLYEGSQIVAEYNSAGVIQRRFVPGPITDQPVVWYEGASQSGGGTRQWLIDDPKGSVIAVANASGTTIGINTYDDSGMPGGSNIGRFQFDGAPWIPEAGLYHMRARAYSPTLGRFMQSDPIGYADGMNFNAFVHDDPVNGLDPSGLGGDFGCVTQGGQTTCQGPTVTAPRAPLSGSPAGNGGGSNSDPGSSRGRNIKARSGVPQSMLAALHMPSDRCAARATPPLTGGPASAIDLSQLSSVAIDKFSQHSVGYNPTTFKAQSYFGGFITSPSALVEASIGLIGSYSNVAAGNGNSRITGNLGQMTGTDQFGYPTDYLTMVLSPAFGTDANDLPLRSVISLYPGC